MLKLLLYEALLKRRKKGVKFLVLFFLSSSFFHAPGRRFRFVEVHHSFSLTVFFDPFGQFMTTSNAFLKVEFALSLYLNHKTFYFSVVLDIVTSHIYRL